MKKLFFGAMFLLIASAASTIALAQVSIGIGIGLPPAFTFSAEPLLVVIPGTNVYCIANYDVDICFYNGFWWRYWSGHWYRSNYYNRSWSYYNGIPVFYNQITNWRTYYNRGYWYNQPWNYRLIPYQNVQRNWNTWQRTNYWQSHGTWGVRNYNAVQPQMKQIHQVGQPKMLPPPHVKLQPAEIHLQPATIHMHQPAGQFQQPVIMHQPGFTPPRFQPHGGIHRR